MYKNLLALTRLKKSENEFKQYDIDIKLGLKFVFCFILLILLIPSHFLYAQQTLSGKDTESRRQQIQSGSLNNFGTLWGWGRNKSGCLRKDLINYISYPAQLDNDYRWKIISSGMYFSIGIKQDGSLWGIGGELQELIGLAVPFTQIGKEKKWKYVAAGERHFLVIAIDSTLWGWGENSSGQLGNGTSISQRDNGIVQVDSLSKWISVFCSPGYYTHCLAFKKDSSLWIWGSNDHFQLGVATQTDNASPMQIGKTNEWLSASPGVRYTLAIKKDYTLWAWGNNDWDQLGDGSTDDQRVPIQIGISNDWHSIAAGANHSLALKKDSTLWAWGANDVGQIGDGTHKSRKTPTQIGTDHDWVSVSINNTRSLGIKKDGSLWCWGIFNDKTDPIETYQTPTKITNLKDVIQVSTSHGDIYTKNAHTLIIRKHLPTLPKVATLPIIEKMATTAESGGKVLSDGGEFDAVRGLCYSTTPNPTISDNTTIGIEKTDSTVYGEYQSFMTDLKSFTKYYVRAYVTNSVGTAYGQEETFTTKLLTPILISPENAKIDVPIEVSLKWITAENALSYRIQLSKTQIFDTPLEEEEISEIVYAYDKYKNNSNYYWRVQAKNGLDTSDWSEIWSFTTAKFNPQVLLSPANDTINVPIDWKLNWKQNSPNSTYILQVSKKENFINRVVDIDLADTYYNCPGLEYLTTYYWRVSSFDGDDQNSWSSVWKFTTLMDSVNLKKPTDLSKYINIPTAMSWQEGIYKKDYRLQISEENDFASTNTDTLISKFANADVKNLNYWQNYFWRVRNESGDTLGYWSEIWQFKTRMSDMLLMYPENTQTGLAQEINFKWYPVIGAEYYQLQISKNVQFTNMVYSKDSITTTEHFVPSLEKDILYYWRVRVWNTESIGTAYWSEVWTFRTGETSVKDEAEVIQIIPNPAGDFITITIERWSPSSRWTPSSTNVIQIYNTLGEMVLAEAIHPMTASHRMNIQSLPKGIYFVKVGGETAKFIKL